MDLKTSLSGVYFLVRLCKLPKIKFLCLESGDDASIAIVRMSSESTCHCAQHIVGIQIMMVFFLNKEDILEGCRKLLHPSESCAGISHLAEDSL